MVSKEEVSYVKETQYQLVPPDGGWGYLVTASVTVMNLTSIVPMAAFGLLYGNFLSSIGDETTGTTLANGLINTVLSFTGLVSSFLLQKYSYRKVGLLGAILFSIGAIALIFVNNFTQMIIFFGIMQGLGIGFMMPASFSAFNCYFDKKQNLMMGIAQAVMVLSAILFPPFVALSMQYYGFRGTLIILAVLSLLNFPAMGVLQPVKWHMKKIEAKEVNINGSSNITKSELVNDDLLKAQIKPLLLENLDRNPPKDELNLSVNSLVKVEEQISKPRFSVINLGDRAASLTVIYDKEYENNMKQLSSTKCMDFSLFKDLKYLNISFGVSLAYTSDVAFMSIIPLILYNIGFNTTDVALLMMVYFGADFVSRILISVASAICTIRNRYVFLAGTFLTAVFRIAFVLRDTYIWKLTTLAALGFFRCLIQTPLPLVFCEEYNDNFPTAFSLYMAVCGVVSISASFLMSGIKSLTQSDVMVVNVLTVALLIASTTWFIELAWNKFKSRKN